MKQIMQDLGHGRTFIVEAPLPTLERGQLQLYTTVTLISPGTERMLVNFGKASYLKKARQQPEKVKLVLEKMKTDGIAATLASVRSKLGQPLPLGYCNVGVIKTVGLAVDGFRPGDRVVSNGPHADIVNIGKNLCVKIPPQVDDETAAFTVVASIGLQGIRLIKPSLGEAIVVIGVGLIGLLTVQLLKAHGCRVLAIDFDDRKLQLAGQFGAEICNPGLGGDPIVMGRAFSRGHGVDGVIITASTDSNVPVEQAAQMCRKRGRIVLVGVTGLALNRADFYEKELSFQVSCSYGPGRYDSGYEKKGLDYPIGFVRWTEQRNFEAVLDMMANEKLDTQSLITHRYLFEEAELAYQALTEDKSVLAVLLSYSSAFETRDVKDVNLCEGGNRYEPSKPVVNFIGAGNYASRVLIPAFKTAGAQCHTIATSGGINAVIHGRKAGFLKASTDVDALLNDIQANTVVIATRHDTHAELVSKAILAGKHVFVEKPLAINYDELAQLEAAYYTAILKDKKINLMVGFNRRFSPHIQKMKALLQGVQEPKSFIMTINAGAISDDHWTQDSLIGGGRIIGEACHFIDLMRYLAGFEVTSVQAQGMTHVSTGIISEDNASILLGFADGSFGTIHYLANGSARFPKERIEVFAAGRVLQLNNFRKLTGFGWPGFKKMNLWQQDKGQQACVQQFLAAIELGLASPIPITEVFEVARISIQAAELLRKGLYCN